MKRPGPPDRGWAFIFVAGAHRSLWIWLWVALSGWAPPLGASQAEVGRDAAGRPVLLIDSAPTAFVPGVIKRDAGEFAAVFAKAETDLLVVSANLGFYHSGFGYVAPLKHMREFWKGYREYDPGEIRRLLSEVVAAQPKAKIILWLLIGEYPGFAARHPDDIIRNDQGDALVAKHHFERFEPYPASAPLKQPEGYAISFFSTAFRAEVGEMLKAFVQAVEASPAGEHVIGYLIGGGQDGQWYSWSPPDGHLAATPANWGDYSPAARRAFRQWLRRRYRDDLRALSRSWGSSPDSFAEAAPPAGADLAGPQPFHDLQREMRAYDWKRFLAEGRVEFIIGMADAIRASTTRKVIIGASGGDGGHRRDNTSTGLLLRARSLDFLMHQATYGLRIPPSTGGLNALLDSYAANGKLFLTDMDHRLWTQAPSGGESRLGVISFNDRTVGRAADMAMQRDMWRREYARLWIAGNHGAWFASFAKPADWDHPELLAEVRFLREQSQRVVSRNAAAAPAGRQPEVVFVFDEAAVDYACGALSEFHYAAMGRQWAEAHASGVPARFYYAQDLRDGKVPPAKLVVLQNLLDLDDTLLKRIRGIRAAGATVVILQGTGAVQLSRSKGEAMRAALGMPLRRLTADDQTGVPEPALAGSHPLLAANRWQPAVPSLETEKLKEVEGIALTADDPALPVLARYPASGRPAAVVAAQSGPPVVFVGAYVLSRDLISRIAAFAGAWRVAPPGNVVAADGHLLMIHPLASGEIDVDLGQPVALRELPPGGQLARAQMHRLAVEAGRTVLFACE